MYQQRLLGLICCLALLLLTACGSSNPNHEDMLKFKKTCNEMGSYMLELGGRKLSDFDINQYVPKLEETAKNVDAWPEGAKEAAKAILAKCKAIQEFLVKEKEFEAEQKKPKRFTTQLNDLERRGKENQKIIDMVHKKVDLYTKLNGLIFKYFKATPDIKLK